MDQSLCREHIAKLMDEETSSMAELAQLLDREHGLLVSNDIIALQAAIRDRQACVGRVVRVDEERRSLCRMLNYPTDVKGLERLMRWCDPQGSLAHRWADCTAAAGRCRALNDRNGALVSARLQRVQGLLGVLIKGGTDAVTYSSRGAYSMSRKGRVLAAEA